MGDGTVGVVVNNTFKMGMGVDIMVWQVFLAAHPTVKHRRSIGIGAIPLSYIITSLFPSRRVTQMPWHQVVVYSAARPLFLMWF